MCALDGPSGQSHHVQFYFSENIKQQFPVIQIPMNDLNLLLLLRHLILCIFSPSHVFPIRGPVCITSITDLIPFIAYKTFSKTEQYFSVKPLLNHVRGGKTQKRHEHSSIWTHF